MKAKLLNPLQDLMDKLVSHSCDMFAQNCNSTCYPILKDWFQNTVIMYSLTVATGNDTYIKTAKSIFDTHIKPQCEFNSHCDSISSLLAEMIALLTA